MRYHLKPLRGKKSTVEKLELILEKGEIFLEYPTNGVGQGIGRVKMGDGVTKYKDLPYFLNTSDSPMEIEEVSNYNESYVTTKLVDGETLKSILGVIKASLKHILNKFNNYVLKSSIVDALDSLNTQAPLSANQGRVLNDKIDTKQDKLTNPLTQSNVIDNLTSTDTNLPLSANQGKVLNDKITDQGKSIQSLNTGISNSVKSLTNSINTVNTVLTNRINKIGTVVKGGDDGSGKGRGDIDDDWKDEKVPISDCYVDLDEGVWLIKMEFGTSINPGKLHIQITDGAGNNISTAGGSGSSHAHYKGTKADTWETVTDFQIVNLPASQFYHRIHLCLQLEDIDGTYKNQRFNLYAIKLSANI